MKVAYARVSTEDQNLERQVENLKSFGAEKTFTEKKPGAAVNNREQFQKALDFVREGTEICELLNYLIVGIASGKYGFTTLRKFKYKKSALLLKIEKFKRTSKIVLSY
ncbi:recombinase family protein [Bacillus sp. V3B]|nr:recombinase family protein [Bacillus sp. V3B]